MAMVSGLQTWQVFQLTRFCQTSDSCFYSKEEVEEDLVKTSWVDLLLSKFNFNSWMNEWKIAIKAGRPVGMIRLAGDSSGFQSLQQAISSQAQTGKTGHITPHFWYWLTDWLSDEIRLLK